MNKADATVIMWIGISNLADYKFYERYNSSLFGSFISTTFPYSQIST